MDCVCGNGFEKKKKNFYFSFIDRFVAQFYYISNKNKIYQMEKSSSSEHTKIDRYLISMLNEFQCNQLSK